jgi:hypothetical protein
MFEQYQFKNKLSKSKEIQSLLDNANGVCRKLSDTELEPLALDGYEYTTEDALDELGLDDELVHQLVEDYVIQILKSKFLFLDCIEELKKAQNSDKQPDYTPLRELAHKNLGVARNLRIKDAEKILAELMTKENLPYLEACVRALESCAIKLKPLCAYHTLKLIDIKNTLLNTFV